MYARYSAVFVHNLTYSIPCTIFVTHCKTEKFSKDCVLCPDFVNVAFGRWVGGGIRFGGGGMGGWGGGEGKIRRNAVSSSVAKG